MGTWYRYRNRLLRYLYIYVRCDRVGSSNIPTNSDHAMQALRSVQGHIDPAPIVGNSLDGQIVDNIAELALDTALR